MVKRLLNFIGREYNGLHEAAFLLGLSAFGSQILALIRDRLLASAFGAGAELDVYYAAFRLPDLLFVFFGSLVSVTVVLPFLYRHLTAGNQAAANRLFTDLARWFLFLILPAIVLIYFLMPFLLNLTAPGFVPAARAELLTLSRLLLLSPLLLGLSNLLANVTQSSRKFFLYALSPILYNLGIIVGLLFFYPRLGLTGLVWGVILGAGLHLAIQWPALARSAFFGRAAESAASPAAGTAKNEWRKIFVLAWPRTLALSANQLTITVLLALASYLAAGSIAVFNFAYNLQSVLLSIIGVSYSVAAFPTLVRLFTAGDQPQFVRQVAAVARHIIFWSLPAITLFIILRAQIVRVILGAGRFDWSDTRLTAAALAIFLISAAAQSLILLLVRGYYACGQTRKPLIINSLSSILIVLLALVLFPLIDHSVLFGEWLKHLWRVADLPATEILILPLAFSIGSLLNLGILWRSFRRDFGSFPPLLSKSFWQTAAAALAAAAATYLLLQLLAPVFNQATFWGIFNQGLLAGLGGLLIDFLILRWFNNEEMIEISRSLQRQFWRRAKPILPPPADL